MVKSNPIRIFPDRFGEIGIWYKILRCVVAIDSLGARVRIWRCHMIPLSRMSRIIFQIEVSEPTNASVRFLLKSDIVFREPVKDLC